MKVTQEIWQERLNNLNKRRETEVIKNAYPEVDDYCNHVNSCYVGKTVLDVGCGLQLIKACLPNEVIYTGIDPSLMVEGTIPMTIEECNFQDNSFETLYCFMVLDGVRDLKETAKHMKRIASKNIVILNGIDINPDRYHTFNITLDILNELFGDLKVGTKKWITNKVLLIEYLI